MAANGFGQVKTKSTVQKKVDLSKLKVIMYDESATKLSYSLYLEGIGDKAIPSSKVMLYYDEYVDSLKNKKSNEINEYYLLKKYKNNILSVISSMSNFGYDEKGKFLFSKNSFPVDFCLNNNNEITMIVSDICFDNIYNTLKLTSRQRISKVLSTLLIDKLKLFSEYFKGNEIKYFGLSAVYGSKDFGSSDFTTSGEFISIICPISVIKKYASGLITEDQLLKSSDVLISDRDMNAGEVKKIQVTIE